MIPPPPAALEVEMLKVQLAEMQVNIADLQMEQERCDCESCRLDSTPEGKALKVSYGNWNKSVGERKPSGENKSWCGGCGGSMSVPIPLEYNIKSCTPNNCLHCLKTSDGWKVNYPAIAKLTPSGQAFIMKSIKMYGALRKMEPELHKQADERLAAERKTT
jgi:hypothetical protein